MEENSLKKKKRPNHQQEGNELCKGATSQSLPVILLNILISFNQICQTQMGDIRFYFYEDKQLSRGSGKLKYGYVHVIRGCSGRDARLQKVICCPGLRTENHDLSQPSHLALPALLSLAARKAKSFHEF